MATTFHLFARLPAELRVRIWELAIEPRTVELHFVKDGEFFARLLYITSSTPVPAVLQSCSEARNELERAGLYQRAFSTSPVKGNEPRYIWTCFETDMISIGHHANVYHIVKRPERLLVQQLSLGGSERDEGFFRLRGYILREFENLKEVHVICEDDMLNNWHITLGMTYWPVGKGNVKFVDKESGRMVDGCELDRMHEELFGKEQQQ